MSDLSKRSIEVGDTVPTMRTIFLMTVPTLLVALAAPVQSPRTAMAGTWVHVPNQASASLPAAPNALLGARLAIAFDGGKLVLTRASGSSSMVVTYPLDGTRVAYPLSGQLCGGDHTMYETAAWEGDSLIVTSVGLRMAGSTGPSDTNNRRVIRMEGDRLIVEGSVMRQGQAQAVASVFARTTEGLPAPVAAPVGTPATIANTSWITGRWEGTSGRSVTTEEHWTPGASGGMIGVGRTLAGGSLSGFEFLCIAERNGSLAYLAMPGARTPATVFMATEVTPTSITFENPAHDYPKLIRYAQTPDGGLETTIAGADGARTAKVTLKRVKP